MTPTTALYDVLAADATLAALLPGGVWRGVAEISRQLAPAAFDALTKELRTCALVKAESETDAGPKRIAGAQLVGVWVYDRTSDTRVEEALARIHELLHRRPLGNGMWEVSRRGATWGWRDEALAAQGGVVRYEVHIYRG